MNVGDLERWLAVRGDEPRARKLRLFLRLLGLLSFFSLCLIAARGAPGLQLIGPALLGAYAFVADWRLQRGASVPLVATLLLLSGIVVVVLHAAASGRDGAVVTLWLLITPLLALSVGGPRSGVVVFVVALASIVFSLLAIDQHWFDPVFELPGVMTRITTVVGVSVIAYATTRLWERETERTIAALETQNRELAAARARAERASRARGEFLAVISHEIRTPLNGVTGMATLLESERDPKRLAEGLTVIRQSANVLLSVINDVLDFSKLEARRVVLEALPLDVAAEAREVVRGFDEVAREHHTTLTCTVDADVPKWVTGDATRVRQVLSQLVSNGVKFAAGGHVEVRVRSAAGQVQLEVHDDGLGMSEEVQARLFTPFTQADTSTTRRFGGTGLGLVIAQRLVQAMGGALRVVSAPGKGSTFTAAWPVTPCDAPRVTPSSPTPVSQSRRVLLVEDNFVNQVVAVRLLEKLGHQVTVAHDGLEALERISMATFDLVLMDCHMPVMDGFTAAKAARERGVTVPIFALTASDEDLERCRASGMNGVLSKPLQLERLAEVVAAG